MSVQEFAKVTLHIRYRFFLSYCENEVESEDSSFRLCLLKGKVQVYVLPNEEQNELISSTTPKSLTVGRSVFSQH